MSAQLAEVVDSVQLLKQEQSQLIAIMKAVVQRESRANRKPKAALALMQQIVEMHSSDPAHFS